MSAVFAQVVRRRMRAQHVTIRMLAKTMGVTMKRVREVRDHGTQPPWSGHRRFWEQDWLDGIRKAADTRNTQ